MTSEPIKPPRRLQNPNDNFAKDAEAARPSVENEDRWVADFIANLTGALESLSRKK